MKNVSWVGFGTLSGIAISIVSVPLILKNYSATEMSYFLFLWTIVGIVNLSDCGVSRGVSKFTSNNYNIKSILLYGYSYLAVVLILLILFYFLLNISYNNQYLGIIPVDIQFLGLVIIFISFITFPLSGYIEGVGGFKESSIAKNICNMITYGMPVILASYHIRIEYVLCFSVLLSRFMLLAQLLYYTIKKNRLTKYLEKQERSITLDAREFYSFCLSVGMASLLGIAFLYWDRFLALNCFSGSILIQYVVYSEIIIKSYAIPSILAGVLFQFFSSGAHNSRRTDLMKYLNVKNYVSCSILVSTLFVFTLYCFNEKIFSILFHVEIDTHLKRIFYIVSFFTVLNCLTMIIMTIGQAVGNHKKILTIQMATLPLFSLASFLLIKVEFIELGFLVWFLRIPTMLISISYFNNKKLGETL
ncbi:hypothetical protein [Escherichia albertii]|uniref:hypothetical protein n=1 Tax=Escherichia albertii TaxID=208962 RepID=UPI0016B6F3B3|nr:hypothetical protein [Escherichia albertii]MCQ8909758.1 hypothetical protein [Escherichia albertii]MCQ8958670.1 hypothetical protein [Escherichia albertii]MCQ8990300.1 hypothetical protein [Escherichia albertii]UUL29303.1 hypothetical protein NIY90_06230 [Escherichia albertii]UUL47555.1 hypothetical protein NIY84_08655 [Escherichia albertii]